MKENTIHIRPMRASDRDMVKEWLRREHAREWWGDPEEEWDLLAEALEIGGCWPNIIELDGEEIGIIQYWRVKEARGEVDDCEEIWLESLDDAVIGVDITIGPARYLGKGLGSRAVRQLCERLRDEGHKEIVIDPDIRNARARRAYQKAGFVRIGQYPESQGGTLLMRWSG